MNQLSFEDKQAYVVGLAVDCPMGNAIDSCIMLKEREAALQERFRLVKSMPEDQLDVIIDHHHACFEKRTGYPLD